MTLRVAQNARIDIEHEGGKHARRSDCSRRRPGSGEHAVLRVRRTITSKELTQLQLNGRNFTQLITLVPGVSNQTGQDEGRVGVEGSISYSVNGGRTEYNNWEVDGGDMMDNGSNFSLNVYPSVEAIQEVQVLTSNYGAQYGKNGSGTVEVETKSGTNPFHGSVWEFARNEAFNAHNYFDVAGTPKAATRSTISDTALAARSGRITHSFSGCRTGGGRTFPSISSISSRPGEIAKGISTISATSRTNRLSL